MNLAIIKHVNIKFVTCLGYCLQRPEESSKIVAEVLATAIRTTNIQGIKIEKEEFKFVQYADDLTVFVPDIENAQRIFNLLDQFKTCSGLQVNYKKTEATWIGSCRNDTAAPLGLTWVITVTVHHLRGQAPQRLTTQGQTANPQTGERSCEPQMHYTLRANRRTIL